MNQPFNNHQPGHPALMGRRPGLTRGYAEEHVPLTVQAQRRRFCYIIQAERAIEVATMAEIARTFNSAAFNAGILGGALRNTDSIAAVQVNGDAQAVDSAQATGNAQTTGGSVQAVGGTQITDHAPVTGDAQVASITQSVNNAGTVSGAQANGGTQTVEFNQASQVTNAPQATVAGLNSLASDGFTSSASTPRSPAGSIFSALPSPASSIFTAMNDNIPRRPVLLCSQFSAQNRYDLHHRNPYHSSLPTQSGLRGTNDGNNDEHYDGDDDTDEEEENNFVVVNQVTRLSSNEDMNTAIAEDNDNDVYYFIMRPEESMGFLQAPRNDVDADINEVNHAINESGGSDALEHQDSPMSFEML